MGRSATSRYAVLGMLARGPRSGYDIKRTIGESIQHFWNESYGQIYPVLRRLSEQGLAVAEDTRRRGKRESKTYALTKKGLRELKQWLSAPVRYETPRNELLLKLFFGGHIPARILREHVEQFRAYHIELLRKYAGIRRQLQGHHPQDSDLAYWLFTLNLGLRRSEAFVRWSEETLRELEVLAGKPRGRKRVRRGTRR